MYADQLRGNESEIVIAIFMMTKLECKQVESGYVNVQRDFLKNTLNCDRKIIFITFKNLMFYSPNDELSRRRVKVFNVRLMRNAVRN